MALLSVVLPSYNEEQNIANTAGALTGLLEEEGIDFELIFVSDGSRDDTYREIRKAAEADPRVRGAEFSRNFGKEASIFAGLSLAKGDAVAVMDCDLQHPPKLLPKMWGLWRQGYEVVEGVKAKRGRESLGHKLSAGLFYKVMSRLIKVDMNASSDFKLLDRKVVDVLLELPERNTFFRALTFWAGFRTASVEYEVAERVYGESKWSLWSLMKYAVSNATSFSTLPLQLVTVMGVVSILFSVILAVQTMVKYLMGTAVEGFTTVILLILIIGGFIMLSLGIIGHYIARIYEEVKGRPKYIISRTTDRDGAERTPGAGREQPERPVDRGAGWEQPERAGDRCAGREQPERTGDRCAGREQPERAGDRGTGREQPERRGDCGAGREQMQPAQAGRRED